jgi:hypothetical protein
MTGPKITTPRGSIISTNGLKARLTWNADFVPKWQRQYTAAQIFCDSEILRLSEPYTPLRTGMLVMSGTLGTVIGSGTVQWIAIYARAQYYGARKPGSETGKLRGPQWFERMKQTHGKEIVAGARRLAGGG